MPTGWARYVTDITAAAPQREVAAYAGIATSVLSRWLAGGTPRAEQAIKFARAYGRPPIEALIAAGYLTDADADATPPAGVAVHPSQSAGDYTNAELVAELERDWHERRRGAAHFEQLMRELMHRLLHAREQ